MYPDGLQPDEIYSDDEETEAPEDEPEELDFDEPLPAEPPKPRYNPNNPFRIK